MTTISDNHHLLLRWIVGLTGLSFILFFGGAILLIGLDITPILMQSGPGRLLLGMLRWGPASGTTGGVAYELMIATLYVVWGIFLLIASRRPLEHKLFLDFSVVGNVAHFGLMLAMGIVMAKEHTHLYGDVLLGWIALI